MPEAHRLEVVAGKGVPATAPAGERPALPVGEEDDDPSLPVRREGVSRGDLAERGIRRRANGGLLRRRALDPHGAVDDAGEPGSVGHRKEVREHAVGEGQDTRRNIRDGGAELDRRGGGPVEAGRGTSAAREAAIDRDVSSTKSAWTSLRPRGRDSRASTGCAAARPRSAIAAAASGGRTQLGAPSGAGRPSADARPRSGARAKTRRRGAGAPRARRARRAASGTPSVAAPGWPPPAPRRPVRAEAAALAGLDARALRAREAHEQLEVEGRIEVPGSARVASVKSAIAASTWLWFATGRGCAEDEDAEQGQGLRSPLRIATSRCAREGVLRPAARTLDVDGVVEPQVQLRRVDVLLQRTRGNRRRLRSRAVTRLRRRRPCRRSRTRARGSLHRRRRRPGAPSAPRGRRAREEGAHGSRDEQGQRRRTRIIALLQSSLGAQTISAASASAATSASATRSHGNGVRSCGGASASVGARATTAAATGACRTERTLSGDGSRPTMRTGT